LAAEIAGLGFWAGVTAASEAAILGGAVKVGVDATVIAGAGAAAGALSGSVATGVIAGGVTHSWLNKRDPEVPNPVMARAVCHDLDNIRKVVLSK
jgi:hypothetical protein